MSRLYIEFRVWLEPTVNTGLVEEKAEDGKLLLRDLFGEYQSPLKLQDVTYMVKRDEERRKV